MFKSSYVKQTRADLQRQIMQHQCIISLLSAKKGQGHCWSLSSFWAQRHISNFFLSTFPSIFQYLLKVIGIQRPICLFLSSQVTSSSPRPSTCRRTISWSSPTTGPRCSPPTSPTARPPVPTTTWASLATSRRPGSTRSRIKMNGEHLIVAEWWFDELQAATKVAVCSFIKAQIFGSGHWKFPLN